ncbi:MAG: MmcQ/YjbR family DNA-binding protein [Acidimicrobiales bacterium]|nr:MmcQ/YjbR family DNA-binding protein [Acidimicrobiales bacterium]
MTSERETLDQSLLDGLRAACLALPGVEERINHGMPTFAVVKRTAFCNLHHRQDDDRPTLWFKAAAGVQTELVDQEPDRFFIPPYVGAKGWVGLNLDVDLDWDEVGAMVEDAWKLVATKGQLAERNGP